MKDNDQKDFIFGKVGQLSHMQQMRQQEVANYKDMVKGIQKQYGKIPLIGRNNQFDHETFVPTTFTHAINADRTNHRFDYVVGSGAGQLGANAGVLRKLDYTSPIQKKQRLIEGHGLTRSDKKAATNRRKAQPTDVPNLVFANEQQAHFEAQKKFEEYMDDINELPDLGVGNEDATKNQNSE